MTYGIVVNGDNNNLLFSTDTKNMFFRGKASFHQAFDALTIDYSGNGSQPFFNFPGATLYEYRFTAPASVVNIIPFVHNSLGKRCAIVSTIKLNSVTWQLFVLSSGNPNVTFPAVSSTLHPPEIYVFSDYIDANPKIGYGASVFNSSGITIFTTNERPLLIKGLYAGTTPLSNLQSIKVGSTTFRVNGPSISTKTITFFNPINTVSNINKTAILYSSNQTAIIGGITRVWECSAVYDNNTKQLGLEWCNIGNSGQQNRTVQSTGTPFTALVIDASQYD